MLKLTKMSLYLFMLMLSFSCTTVKAYQKQFLNDYYMKPEPFGIAKSESEAITYREGASGGESAKTGGGCGCN